MMLPHVPMLRGLVMEPMDEAALEESEKLGDFSHLFGQTGIATTPLRPSGKARFGEQVIQVVSDGTAIAAGDQVRVCEVHATKVVVEPLEVR
jgi:membrane-bound ClpP family serine protease